MKQGKQYFTIMLWVILAAIAVYFGYNAVSGLYAPLMTATVVEYEAGAGYYATGFVVRDEAVIRSDSEITVLTMEEGAHVSAGSTVAIGYLSDGAQQRHSRIAELQSQLEQLRYAYQYSSSVYDQAKLDEQISDDLLQLSRYLSRKDMNSADDLVPELKGLVLRRSSRETDAEELAAQIETMEEELEKLESQADTDTRAVTVSAAGHFSGSVDGYEDVLTPEFLESFNVLDYNALAPERTSPQAIGKLIRGATWYFITALPSAELADVEAGSRVQLTFARDFYTPVTMKVERVGKNEAGSRILVLSCNRYMQNVTLLRQQSADILFSSHSGLRVPKEAVRVDADGQAGVFVLEGAVARWKNIEILHDNGESYVVTLNKSSTKNLWPGDEVIINAKNLTEGKVVQE